MGMDNVNDRMAGYSGTENGMSSLSIKDGLGGGNDAEVTSANDLAVTSGDPFERARALGNAYSWTVTTADVNAGDTLLIVRNDSSTMDLVIESVRIFNGDAEPTVYDLHVVKTAYTSSGGGATKGTNLNSNYGNGGDATCDADETANAQGTVLEDFNALTADTWYTVPVRCQLGNGHAFGVDQITESDSGACTIYGYFVER